MNGDKELPGEFLGKIERLLCHSAPGGGLNPAASIEHWERTIAAAPESSRELLRELARFADLWRFFRDREEDLRWPKIVLLKQLAPAPVCDL
jgi:hypothetical protein